MEWEEEHEVNTSCPFTPTKQRVVVTNNKIIFFIIFYLMVNTKGSNSRIEVFFASGNASFSF